MSDLTSFTSVTNNTSSWACFGYFLRLLDASNLRKYLQACLQRMRLTQNI